MREEPVAARRLTAVERVRANLFVGLGLARRAMTLGVKAYVTDGERVLLVRHTYLPGWHLPGGGVERRETVWDAVAKEVREETHVGLTGRPALFGVYKNGRTSRFDHIAMFVARDWREVRVFEPNFEIAECRFFPQDDLPDEAVAATAARVREVEGDPPPADHW